MVRLALSSAALLLALAVSVDAWRSASGHVRWADVRTGGIAGVVLWHAPTCTRDYTHKHTCLITSGRGGLVYASQGPHGPHNAPPYTPGLEANRPRSPHTGLRGPFGCTPLT
jgi:hypothetical protein